MTIDASYGAAQTNTAGSLIRPDERVRLLRSTRKVAHLLGETPLIVDTSSSNPPSSHGRNARRLSKRIYGPVRSSSLREAPALPAPSLSTAPVRPVLAVRVPAVPLDIEPPSPSASFWLASPAATPTSAFSFTFSPTPPSAVLEAASSAAEPDPDALRLARTRKMARVVRTLGERVPAELVFGDSVQLSTSRRPSTLAKRRSGQGQGRVRAGRRDSLVDATSIARAGRRESLAKEWDRERATEKDKDRWEEDSASVYSTLSGGDWECVAPPRPYAAVASHPNARAASGLKISTTPTTSPFISSKSALPSDGGPGRTSSFYARRPHRPTITTATLPFSASPAAATPPLSTSSLMTPATSSSPYTPFSGTMSTAPPLPPPASFSHPSFASSNLKRPPSPADPVLGGEGYSPFSQHLGEDDTTPDYPHGHAHAPTHPHGATHRSEKGWSGEWVSSGVGVQNMSMDEVAKRLRGLRVK
ncbi:hypothetical protein B0H19DRAFT_189440 [Mycena capillaripes]|nr:hypothetical protein B0H19DRAFT_189440 [Mycena capillaripes]